MYKGVKPQGQPRSLRSIVETHNSTDNFPDIANLSDDAHRGEYRDAADAAKIRDGGRQVSPADPQPFQIRGK